jgi:toxin ParE1/3/4
VTSVVFSDDARAELRAAKNFYDAVSPRLAERFAQAAELAVQRVAAAPLTWPPVAHNIRRCLLSRFPYSLVYRTDAEPLRVIAVMHHRQRPGYWRGRP